MDLDIICLLLLHRVSAKLKSTLVVTRNDSRSVELDFKPCKEFL
jgi:hypothetical protein